MTARLRPVAVLALILLAVIAYQARIRHEMVDFLTWRQNIVRSIHAEPLYRSEDEHYRFKYFPISALMMAPLGVLDQENAKRVWFALSVALLAFLIAGSVAALPERRQPERVVRWITIVLMAKFSLHELLLGQTNLLLGALLLGALLAVQRRRRLWAGALVGIAVLVKPYALIVIPWLLIAQGWASAAIAAGVVLAGLVMPAVVYGWNGNIELLRGWVDTVRETTAPNLLGSDNVSVVAMWTKWLGAGPTASLLAALTLLALLALVVLIVRRRGATRSPEYLELATLMLLIPLVSPQGWDYVLLLGTPAVVCIVDRWQELATPWRWILGLALGLMCLTIFDVMGRALYGRFMAVAAVSVCALTIAAGLAHLRWRELA
jgi:hypothetical protein